MLSRSAMHCDSAAAVWAPHWHSWWQKNRVLLHVKHIFTMLAPRWWAQGQGWWEPWAQGSGWWEPWPRAQGGGSHGPRVVGALGSGWLEPRAQGGWSLGPEGFLEESDPPFKSEGTSLISKYGTLHICKYGHGHIFKNRRHQQLNGGCVFFHKEETPGKY